LKLEVNRKSVELEVEVEKYKCEVEKHDVENCEMKSGEVNIIK